MEDVYEKKLWKIEKKKNFEKIFTNFFFLKKFSTSYFFFNKIFFTIPRWGASVVSGWGGSERSERRGDVGERSKPPAGVLAVEAEGSVNSELFKNYSKCRI